MGTMIIERDIKKTLSKFPLKVKHGVSRSCDFHQLSELVPAVKRSIEKGEQFEMSEPTEGYRLLFVESDKMYVTTVNHEQENKDVTVTMTVYRIF